MDNDKVGQRISDKLSALIALALVPEAPEMNLRQKVELLTRFGIPNQEVADILGTTKGTVEVLKSTAKKRK